MLYEYQIDFSDSESFSEGTIEVTTTNPLQQFDSNDKSIKFPSAQFFAEPQYQLLENIEKNFQTPDNKEFDASAITASSEQIEMKNLEVLRIIQQKIYSYRAERGPYGYERLRTYLPAPRSENGPRNVLSNGLTTYSLEKVNLPALCMSASIIGKVAVFVGAELAQLVCPVCGCAFAAQERGSRFLRHLALEKIRLHAVLLFDEQLGAEWRLLANELICRALGSLQRADE